MRAPTVLSPLLAAALLAGCSFGQEASVDVDRSEYDGGGGVAIAVANNGTDRFHLDIRVLGVGNAELVSLNETLQPGDAIERWYSLPQGTYSARFSYVWDAAAGRTARGMDDQTFTIADCPAVSRLSWTLVQQDAGPGSRYEGKACVSDEDA